MHSGIQKPGVYRPSSLRRSLLVGCEEQHPERAGRGTSRNPCKNSAPASTGLSTHTGGWEEESAMAFRRNSDLQLLHLAREARKLNQTIDSWSKSPSFDGRPTGIAADLLRGALELQESLFMLEKLQEEASSFAADTRRHGWDAVEEEEMAALGLMGSRRFESSNCRGTAQVSQRVPVDGSSRSRREELKKVIQTSLRRQNLVTISSDEEKAPPGRSLKLPPPRNGFRDARIEEGHKREGSNSAAAEQKKGKSPNLIARLMGLEEVPSEDFQSPVSSRSERRKNPNQARHFSDAEMPKASKPPPPEEKPAPERKTLQEIIDAMQFKGLLRAEPSEEPQARSPAEQYSRWLPAAGEAPPIVIIKPMTSAGLKAEGAHRAPYVETNHAPPLQEKGHFSRAVEAAAPRSVLPIQAPPRSVLQMQMENRVERPVAKDHKVEVHCKNSTSASSHLKQLKRETDRMRQKPAEMQRVASDGGRVESRSVRSATGSGLQSKATSSIPSRKPESRRPVHPKYHVSAQASSSSHVERRSARPATGKAVDSARERKTTGTRPIKEPAIPTQQIDSPKSSREENVETIPVQEKTIPEILSSSTLPSNAPPREREQNYVTTKRDSGKDSSFHCEVMPKRSHGGGGNPHVACLPERDTESSIKVPAESTDELKLFLLCSPSFLLRAQELFNIHHHQPADFHIPETNKWTALGGSKLITDCSTELMASRSRRLEHLNHPLSRSPLKRPESKISVNKLLDEISEEMENLRSYSRGGDAVKDSLYERLERDLMCRRVFALGAWDWGWIEVVPMEEAERTVCDVEKLVLNDLIEEAAVELLR